MKALSLDCALSKIAIAAKKDDQLVKVTYDIGIKQSQKLLPAIDFVMKELSLSPEELDYTTLTLGPGSFTSLRLGLSALKALTLTNKVPVYGIPTLEAAAHPYLAFGKKILSSIESKESEYFYQIIDENSASEVGNGNAEEIYSSIKDEEIFLCGQGAEPLAKELASLGKSVSLILPYEDSCQSLFALAEKKIEDHAEPLQEYDGPLYCRKSEAELVLEKKQGKE